MPREGRIRRYPARCRDVRPTLEGASSRDHCTGSGRLFRVVSVALATPRPGALGRACSPEIRAVDGSGRRSVSLLRRLPRSERRILPRSDGVTRIDRLVGQTQARAFLPSRRPSRDQSGIRRPGSSARPTERPQATRSSVTFSEEPPLPGAEQPKPRRHPTRRCRSVSASRRHRGGTLRDGLLVHLAGGIRPRIAATALRGPVVRCVVSPVTPDISSRPTPETIPR